MVTVFGTACLALFVMGQMNPGRQHQRYVMMQALAIVDLDPALASNATYRRIDLRGNDCPWIDTSARQISDMTIQLSDAEPVATQLEANGWAVRRWVIPASPEPKLFEITAAKDSDELRLSIGENSLGLSVDTRPCLVEPKDLLGFGGAIEVDHFPR